MTEEFLYYYMAVPKTIEVNGRRYNFVPQNNVSGCMVQLEDVQAILDVRIGCCNQRVHAPFRRSTTDHEKRWKGELK